MSSHDSRESRPDGRPGPADGGSGPAEGRPDDAAGRLPFDVDLTGSPVPEDELPDMVRYDPAEMDPAEFDAAVDVPEPPEPPAWDADDPRRKKDCFAPPTEPCECHCLHCGRTFSSEGIWFQKVINDPQGFAGFWMCPTANCSGAGFTFDIFPTDPAHPANEGWHTFDDEDEDDDHKFIDDDDDDDSPDAKLINDSWPDDEDADDSDNPFAEAEEAEPEYDPAEPHYKDMDEFLGPDDDDDIEGEEWKYGLQPGERPARSSIDDGARDMDEQERMYDQPDQRPRMLDWSDREDRQPEAGSGGNDDIPF